MRWETDAPLTRTLDADVNVKSLEKPES